MPTGPPRTGRTRRRPPRALHKSRASRQTQRRLPRKLRFTGTAYLNVSEPQRRSMASLTFAQTSPPADARRLPPSPRTQAPPSRHYSDPRRGCRPRPQCCRRCPASRRRPLRPAPRQRRPLLLWRRSIPRRRQSISATRRLRRPHRRRSRRSLASHRLFKKVSLPEVDLCEVPLNTVFIASLAVLRPQSQLPFALTGLVQGPSRPVNHHSSPQLHDQVHPPGAPASVAVGSYNDTRALNGASYSMYDFVQLLGEQNIQLSPAGTASIGFRPVDPQQGFIFSAEPSPEPRTPPAPAPRHLQDDGSLPPSSPPPPSSPTPEPSSVPSPPPAQAEAGPSREPAVAEHTQPLPLFRFGPVRPKTPTDSEGSTDTASPEPEPTPAPRPTLQRLRAYTRLDVGLPSSPEVPRLRPARFSPPPQRRPLRREASFRMSPPAVPVHAQQPVQAETPAQGQAAPSGRPTRANPGPSRQPVPAQAQAEPARAGTKRKVGPLVTPARAPPAAPASRPQGEVPAAEPRHPTAAPMRMRDPVDGRFFMPMLPANVGTHPTPEPCKYLLDSHHLIYRLHVQYSSVVVHHGVVVLWRSRAQEAAK